MVPIRTSAAAVEFPGVVAGLVIANVAVWLVQSGLPPELAQEFILQNGLVPGRYTDPAAASALGLDPGNFLPFITNSFMHAGWGHLIVNMWTLWLFGRPLEDRLGGVRFLALYLACGIAASLSHFAFNPQSTVPALGASGAIAGVLGGYALLVPRTRVTFVVPVSFFPFFFELPALIYIALWFGVQLAQGLADLFTPVSIGGIAWWAHVGGFLASWPLVRVMGTRRRGDRQLGTARAGNSEREMARLGARTGIIGPVRSRARIGRPAGAGNRGVPASAARQERGRRPGHSIGASADGDDPAPESGEVLVPSDRAMAEAAPGRGTGSRQARAPTDARNPWGPRPAGRRRRGSI